MNAARLASATGGASDSHGVFVAGATTTPPAAETLSQKQADQTAFLSNRTKCECGAPIVIKSAGVCLRCYHREHARRRAAARAPRAPLICAGCDKRPISRGYGDLCLDCGRRRLYATPCTYEAAHLRVRRARGSATQWRCISCGEMAQQWAYREGSPRELAGERTLRRRGTSLTCKVRWSPDPADYDPLCVPCHGRSTRVDWGAGQLRDPEIRRARERARYAAAVATPEGRAAYNARKRARPRRAPQPTARLSAEDQQ